jgi:ankyrin repeat protein
LLLGKGASINAISRNGEKVTPLHSALANRNNAAVAQILIDHGADLTLRQSAGMTPLHYAAANGLEAIVKNLISRGVDLFARDNDGKTAGDIAREKGCNSVAELLKSP